MFALPAALLTLHLLKIHPLDLIWRDRAAYFEHI